VGSGGSQEAPFDLEGSVPAGTYHFVLDGIIEASVDVTFDLIWRRGSTDTTLVEWTMHFDPKGGGDFSATAYEVDEATQAIDYESGDQLVFRYTGANTTSTMGYIPNGDGALSKGRDPNITLPQ